MNKSESAVVMVNWIKLVLLLAYSISVVLSSPLERNQEEAQIMPSLRHYRKTRSGSQTGQPLRSRFLFFRKTPDEEIEFRTHQNWVLECEAGGSPQPTIHWLKNGREIPQGIQQISRIEHQLENVALQSSANGMSSTKSRLFLDCLMPQDEGEYTCVAETPFQRHTSTAKLVVAADVPSLSSQCVSLKKSAAGKPATIYMWTGNMLQPVGSNALLFCRVTGEPKPRVRWFVDDEQIKTNMIKYQLFDNGDLLIRNVDWADMGSYVCESDNSNGRDSTATFLYPVATKTEEIQ